MFKVTTTDERESVHLARDQDFSVRKGHQEVTTLCRKVLWPYVVVKVSPVDCPNCRTYVQ
jgi:hypothetical protein